MIINLLNFIALPTGFPCYSFGRVGHRKRYQVPSRLLPRKDAELQWLRRYKSGVDAGTYGGGTQRALASKFGVRCFVVTSIFPDASHLCGALAEQAGNRQPNARSMSSADFFPHCEQRILSPG